MAFALMKTVGLDDLVKNLKDSPPRVVKSIKKTLFRVANNIMTDAKFNYVPVEHNALRSSGVVMEPEQSGHDISCSMGFGGHAGDYALAVHEHLSQHSPPSWKAAEAKGHGVKFRVGGPKYLERPFFKGVEKLEDELAKDLMDRDGIGAFGGGASGGGLL